MITRGKCCILLLFHLLLPPAPGAAATAFVFAYLYTSNLIPAESFTAHFRATARYFQLAAPADARISFVRLAELFAAMLSPNNLQVSCCVAFQACRDARGWWLVLQNFVHVSVVHVVVLFR